MQHVRRVRSMPEHVVAVVQNERQRPQRRDRRHVGQPPHRFTSPRGAAIAAAVGRGLQDRRLDADAAGKEGAVGVENGHHFVHDVRRQLGHL